MLNTRTHLNNKENDLTKTVRNDRLFFLIEVLYNAIVEENLDHMYNIVVQA